MGNSNKATWRTWILSESMFRSVGLVAVFSHSLASAWASSKFIASRCRGISCDKPKAPMMEYDEANDKCVCKPHPCWDDDGSFHKCDANSDTPFICGGLRGEAPILDWDEEQGRCRCREHPCKDINGVQHGCSGYFPILRYKEELQDGNVVPKCDCVMPMRGPTGDHYDHINYDL